MALHPVGHRLLVKPDDVNDRLQHDLGNGKKLQIVVEDKNVEKSKEVFGTLVAVGPDAWKAFGKDFNGAPWAKVGDRVTFSQHAGRYLTDPESDEQLLIMNDEDIICVVTGEKDK